ncbi:hypothetical protein FTX61_16575 [Nitriliruptoraceae bacterium ZYF776]|nr:hypothetical protein [Profundirhabdus halotolerans]
MTGRAVPAFDPARYPGPRPDGPTLVHDGRVHPLHLDHAAPHLRAAVDAPVLAGEVRRWVVAYGANASPGRLVDKGLDRRGAVLLPAVVTDHVPAFESRRTVYGSVPLTLVRQEGARTATWVLGVHVDDTDVLDRSEGRAIGSYRLGHVGVVAVADRFVLDDALAYLPGPDTVLQRDAAGGWRTWPQLAQADASAHLDAAGPAVPAPTPSRTVAGDWPVATLRRRPPPVAQGS